MHTLPAAIHAGRPPRLCLTLDTDWVPQFVLDHVLELLAEHKVPATFFCTTPYAFPAGLELETALHPNFLPGSTHGRDEASCLAHVRTLYPRAKGSRSHAFYWHTGLRGRLLEHGLSYDASMLCPMQSHLGAFDFYGLVRLPTWWSDGFHILSGLGLETFDPPGLDEPGLKILNFHPIHIYCNTADLQATRTKLAGLRLFEATPAELAPARRAGAGVERVFLAALRRMASDETAAPATLDTVCREVQTALAGSVGPDAAPPA